MNFQHILVPTDFSDSSQKALAEAIEFAKRFSAKISVAHVIEPLYMGPEFGPWWADFEASRREQTKAKLDEAVKSIPAENRGETAVLDGTAWSEICHWASGHSCELIILPTHGYSGLKHLWLGSTAERVVQHAHCPVLVIRGAKDES